MGFVRGDHRAFTEQTGQATVQHIAFGDVQGVELGGGRFRQQLRQVFAEFVTLGNLGLCHARLELTVRQVEGDERRWNGYLVVVGHGGLGSWAQRKH